MKFAYADPPYLGCCGRYEHFHGNGPCWDEPEAHEALITRLLAAYPDGWALSCSTPSLGVILRMCPDDARVAAWVKPFAVFKPNVNPAYAWEPVIFVGGRKRDRAAETVRDWHAASITLERGTVGAKPESFCAWVLELLGFDAIEDTLDDIYPGSGVMGRVSRGFRYRLAI